MPLVAPGSAVVGRKGLKLFVAGARMRSRTSSIPAFEAKNAVCSSRKFALTLVSVLDIMTMPIKTALRSSNTINAKIRAIPCWDVLGFLPRKRIIVFSYLHDIGAPDAAIEQLLRETSPCKVVSIGCLVFGSTTALFRMIKLIWMVLIEAMVWGPPAVLMSTGNAVTCVPSALK